jgi:hypothetical protein
MSYHETFYVVYGIKSEYDPDFLNEYYDKEDQCKDLGIIVDGCSGQYIVFGKILFKRCDDNSNHNDDFTSTSISDFDKFSKEYRENFAKIFPNYQNKVINNFNILAFIHIT